MHQRFLFEFCTTGTDLYLDANCRDGHAFVVPVVADTDDGIFMRFVPLLKC